MSSLRAKPDLASFTDLPLAGNIAHIWILSQSCRRSIDYNVYADQVTHTGLIYGLISGAGRPRALRCLRNGEWRIECGAEDLGPVRAGYRLKGRGYRSAFLAKPEQRAPGENAVVIA